MCVYLGVNSKLAKIISEVAGKSLLDLDRLTGGDGGGVWNENGTFDQNVGGGFCPVQIGMGGALVPQERVAVAEIQPHGIADFFMVIDDGDGLVDGDDVLIYYNGAFMGGRLSRLLNGYEIPKDYLDTNDHGRWVSGETPALKRARRVFPELEKKGAMKFSVLRGVIKRIYTRERFPLPSDENYDSGPGGCSANPAGARPSGGGLINLIGALITIGEDAGDFYYERFH